MLASARSPALRMTGTAGIRHHDRGNDSEWPASGMLETPQVDGPLATPPSSEKLCADDGGTDGTSSFIYSARARYDRSGLHRAMQSGRGTPRLVPRRAPLL